jgi:type I restriction enzyme S subunit
LNFAFILLKSLKLETLGKGIKPGVNRNEAYQLITSLPPRNEQRRIVAKVDNLMALCDELEARQQKKQEARLRLNSATLDRLLAAHEPDEFAHHWAAHLR